jgi:anti-anti-sigma factor
MPSILNPRLRVESGSDRTLVTFLGSRLDADDVGAVSAELAGMRGRPLLRLDLAHVEYLNGATLAALVTLYQQVRAARGQLTLENVEPFVFEVFEVTGLTRLLSVWGKSAVPGARAAV